MSNSDFVSPVVDAIDIIDYVPLHENEATITAGDEVATECPICFDPCTNQGAHRLVATKCGHLFGKSCLRTAFLMKPECPTCRKRCRRKEFVELYDCKVVMADSSVIDNLKSEVMEERMNRQKVCDICGHLDVRTTHHDNIRRRQNEH